MSREKTRVVYSFCVDEVGHGNGDFWARATRLAEHPCSYHSILSKYVTRHGGDNINLADIHHSNLFIQASCGSHTVFIYLPPI